MLERGGWCPIVLHNAVWGQVLGKLGARREGTGGGVPSHLDCSQSLGNCLERKTLFQ